MGESSVPEVIVLGPSPGQYGNPISTYEVVIRDCQGPLEGALVEVEFSPGTMAMVAWCGAPPPPVSTAATGSAGKATFQFFGGGCIRPDDANTPAPWVAEVRVTAGGSTVVLAHPCISSPDAVGPEGIPSVSGVSTCTPPSSTTSAGLADAVFHTAPISQHLAEMCSKMTPPFEDPVGLLDAIYITQYLVIGSTCNCQ